MSQTHDDLFRSALLRAYNQRDDAAFDRLLRQVEEMQTELRQGDPMGDLIQVTKNLMTIAVLFLVAVTLSLPPVIVAAYRAGLKAGERQADVLSPVEGSDA